MKGNIFYKEPSSYFSKEARKKAGLTEDNKTGQKRKKVKKKK